MLAQDQSYNQAAEVMNETEVQIKGEKVQHKEVKNPQGRLHTWACDQGSYYLL